MERFEETLPNLLYRTLDCVMPMYRQMFEQHGLTQQQWRVLRVLWEDGVVSSGQIAKKCYFKPSSLVGIIDRLELKGLVERQTVAKNRRSTNIILTDLGSALELEVKDDVLNLQGKIRETLEPEQWKQLDLLLREIKVGLEGSER